MSQPPAFQCYAKDLLADTEHLTNEEFGAYWRLVCQAWIQDGLSTDDGDLARLARTPPSRFRRLWARLACFFGTGWRADGRLSQKRLEIEREKQAAFRAERSATGKTGAARRWRRGSATASGMPAGIAERMAEPQAEAGESQWQNDGSSSASADSRLSDPPPLPSVEAPPAGGSRPNGAGRRRASPERQRLPEEFSLTDDDEAYARERGYSDGDIDRMFTDFCEKHWAKGDRMLDWHLAWKTWVRKEPEYRPKGRP